VLDNKKLVKPLNARKRDDFKLQDATVIVRDGYGMRKFVAEKINHEILNVVKHTFTIDITGTELCYLAAGRDIVHIVVEARRHMEGDKYKGADGYNLIPYPLIKAAGAMIYDLNGIPLDDEIYIPSQIYDFIASASRRLLNDFIRDGVKKNAN
jgi:hypothetical protein